jgi:hypothetical protein
MMSRSPRLTRALVRSEPQGRGPRYQAWRPRRNSPPDGAIGSQVLHGEAEAIRKAEKGLRRFAFLRTAVLGRYSESEYRECGAVLCRVGTLDSHIPQEYQGKALAS